MERKNIINNSFYDFLREGWHQATYHPIALLRAENALRNPWILETIHQKKGNTPALILDVGCGAGFLCNTLARHKHQVFGIDLSETSLNVARENDSTRSVVYQKADAYQLPFSDHYFDVICAMDLLEHVETPERVIAEIARTLKPGGLFFFHTFSRNFWSWLMVIKGVEWCVLNTPSHMHIYSLFLNPLELKQMCEHHKMEVVHCLGVRPDFKHSSFWKMLATRKVPEDFRFTFTKSLKTGYSGFALKRVLQK